MADTLTKPQRKMLETAVVTYGVAWPKGASQWRMARRLRDRGLLRERPDSFILTAAGRRAVIQENRTDA